ncbi:MAG: tripartite tricarboxylate transporter substrate binding protein [Burkholderiales bacterium]|nr:tripartite tricarboxylate transporter substrate binding protein [Burkholderiales bacterium]
MSLLAVTTTFHPGAVRAAAPFPTKTVTLLVPYAAGGGMDAMARALAPHLQAQWGQSVIVENVGGAQSLLGTNRVIQASRDGHVMLVQNAAILTLSRLYKGIDPMASLQPASLVASLPILLAVHPSVPARDMKQFFDYCKTKSGAPCSFGAGETVGSALNRKLAAEARIDNAVQIPYRGTGPLVTDVRGGHVTIGWASVASALQHHKTGGLRIIGVATEAGRVPQLSEVATFQEQGLKDIYPTWMALFLPTGASKAVAESVDAAVRKAVANEEFRKTLDRMGAIPSAQPRAEFARSLPREQKVYEDLLDRFPIQQ